MLVDEVDPEEQRRTDEDSRAAAAAAHEARLAEQLRAAERLQVGRGVLLYMQMRGRGA